MKLETFQSRQDVELLPNDQRTITLIGWGVRVDWQQGGLIWHHPQAVEVWRANTRHYHPIIDVTRLLQLAFWLVTLLFITAPLWQQTFADD